MSPPTARLKILIVDDSAPVRRGVGGILALRPDFACCGEAQDGAEAIEKNNELRPDLILLDLSMPGLNGLEVTRVLRAASPGLKILILSQHDVAQLLPRALQAGANGCVDKSQLSAELLPAIDRILHNEEAQTTSLGS